MAKIIESDVISGVYIANLQIYGDTRGSFREMFRKDWFPQRDWQIIQSNCSHSKQGVLRGLHYHFHQVDYWYVVAGEIRAALFDMRPQSPTYMATQTVDMGGENDIGLFIPIGVAHGFATLRDARLVYIVDNYYDSSDEFGVAWDDPQLNLDWGHRSPILSRRDQQNPHLADIPEQDLPR